MEFTTETGLVLTLKKVSPALLERVAAEVARKFREDGEQIDPPTYDLQTVAGETQTFVLTKEEDITSTIPEREELKRALWNTYQEALSRLRVAQEEARIKYLLTWGVSFDMPEDEEWKDKLADAGIEMPERPGDIRFLYLSYEGLTGFELQRLLVELQVVAYGEAVDPETVDSFRQGAERAARNTATQRIEGAIRLFGLATGQQSGAGLDVEHPTEGDAGGESVGDNPE